MARGPVRFGIVGLGLIGRVHLGHLMSGAVSGAVLTAVNDVSRTTAPLPDGVEFFDSLDRLLDSGRVDAVIVAAPHVHHVEIGLRVIRSGLHLLMEKPLAPTKLECERLVSAPLREGQKFGLMLQRRTHPLYRRLRGMIATGELGEIQRTQWTSTNWFRTDAYYRQGGWRATWRGERGGVLVNQAQHTLDLWQWLCGMPASVHAICQFGRYHPIETEDSVLASCVYANGAAGVFVAATGEAPGVNRLEIAGSKGLAVVENERLWVTLNSQDSAEFRRSSDDLFGVPASVQREIRVEEPFASHAGVIQNFVEAIAGREPLIAEAGDGVGAVELANAMLLSAWTGSTVPLPLNGAAYERELAKRLRPAL